MTPVSTNGKSRWPNWAGAAVEWLPTPDEADFETHRLAGIVRLAPAAAAVHVLYVPLFAWWGVWPLAAFNVVSVAVWGTAILLMRRGRYLPGARLIFVEMVVHAGLVVLFVGWGFGGQYYLLVTTVGAFTFPLGRRQQLMFLATCTTLFVVGYYYTLQVAPIYEVPSVPLAVLNILNIAAVFGFVALSIATPTAAVKRAQDAFVAEHARSERLLTNVLPVPIAERLKKQEEVIADGVDGASVLFADIVGFTVLSSQRTPDEVVSMLNRVFTRLDALVDEFGLEKIKTIGDAYMVAAGIPVPREDHAQVLARFALAARDELAEHNLTADVPVELRIGINSGPVVAGVIGRRRFLYDLWGDTVNTASRMESHGLPGQIQITESTRALLDGEFTCTERGVIDVKGKGPTRTWLVEAERNLAPAI